MSDIAISKIEALQRQIEKNLLPYVSGKLHGDFYSATSNNADAWLCFEFRDLHGTWHSHIHYFVSCSHGTGWGVYSHYLDSWHALPPEIQEVLTQTVETFSVIYHLEGQHT